MKSIFIVGFLISFFTIGLVAQLKQKETIAIRTSQAIKVDGRIDELAWEKAAIATDFYQLEPYNGQPAWQESEVKVIYDDNALYIGAVLYDTAPDSILTTLSPRDEFDNVDYFGFYLDPFNEGVNAFGFFVSAAGVQMDLKANDQNRRREDTSWDAVWESKVALAESGWQVEIKIPYSAIRFTADGASKWGINFIRNIYRHRQNTTWNPVDAKIDGMVKQNGLMTGISDITPPTRLFFAPYLSAYVTHDGSSDQLSTNFRGGLDMKYGINESFTLDMMLIPDFGQVSSDDQVLNLSPFEIKYKENRQFFTEGVEMFQRGGVFYTRRIGGRPFLKGSVGDSLRTNEIIVDNPIQSQLYNATKVSGKTDGGLGIGFFNALSRESFAEVEDTLINEKREVLTQPITNYNMVVIEQALKNQSFISLFNTNMYRGHDYYTSNITGTEMRFENGSNTYAMKGKLIASQIYKPEKKDIVGYNGEMGYEKVKGQFRHNFGMGLVTDDYDINDMGYQRQNNYTELEGGLSYRTVEPFGAFIILSAFMYIGVHTQYKPYVFKGTNVFFQTKATLRNYLTLSLRGNINPIGFKDFYEPRVDGYYYYKDPSWSLGGFLSSDYRKFFAVDVNLRYEEHANFTHKKEYGIEVSPRIRLGKRGVSVFETSIDYYADEPGYVDSEDNGDGHNVYFGVRDKFTVVNVLESRYSINNVNTLTFRVRHYWSKANYEEGYFRLLKSGNLEANNYHEEHDIRLNTFNIDMGYKWHFAPGSQLSLVWKNNIYSDDRGLPSDYFSNFKSIFDVPQTNSVSVRILYHLDYLYLQNKT